MLPCSADFDAACVAFVSDIEQSGPGAGSGAVDSVADGCPATNRIMSGSGISSKAQKAAFSSTAACL